MKKTNKYGIIDSVMKMSQFENYETMFAQSIGIKDPWEIERAEFNEETREVHIYVKARKTAKYPCPKCGEMCARYDDEETERVWRHGDVVFFPCYVHCKRPRIKCKDGIHVVTAPWARPGSRYTMLFESYAMLLLKSMPINQARKLLRISHTSLSNIMKYWVYKAVNAENLSKVKAICVDETSFKRGQSYVTIVSDARAKKVIDVEEGRGSEAVENFSYKLEAKGGSCENITLFVSDMSKPYKAAKDLCFPGATQVIDKFHIKQEMLKAMDEVRRQEQGKEKSRSKDSGKKLLMIPESRQTEQQKAKVAQLSKLYPKTGRAFRMIQSLDVMYKCEKAEDGEKAFEKLVSWLKRSRIEPMKAVAKTLLDHKESILAYFYHRVTNAMAEAINSLIQNAKRRARGFRTFEGYECMIYLSVGKLKLDCPSLFA